MEQFFPKDYSGAPFELFGPAHLTALGIIALIGLSFVLIRKMWKDSFFRPWFIATARQIS
jgi:hypothetical protein